MIYEFDATSDAAESYRRGWEDGHSAAGRSGIAAFVTGFLLASLIGIVAVVALLVAPAAASRSALESSPVSEEPRVLRAARGPSEAPLDPASVSAAVPGDVPAVGALSSPAPTVEDGVGETDIGTALEAGIASYVNPSLGSRYLALPEGRGVRVTICSEGRCVTRVSTDAGPDKAMQRAGRVADVSYSDFAYLCACRPPTVGLIQVTVERGGPSVTLPPTDREGFR